MAERRRLREDLRSRGIPIPMQLMEPEAINAGGGGAAARGAEVEVEGRRRDGKRGWSTCGVVQGKGATAGLGQAESNARPADGRKPAPLVGGLKGGRPRGCRNGRWRRPHHLLPGGLQRILTSLIVGSLAWGKGRAEDPAEGARRRGEAWQDHHPVALIQDAVHLGRWTMMERQCGGRRRGEGDGQRGMGKHDGEWVSVVRGSGGRRGDQRGGSNGSGSVGTPGAGGPRGGGGSQCQQQHQHHAQRPSEQQDEASQSGERAAGEGGGEGDGCEEGRQAPQPRDLPPMRLVDIPTMPRRAIAKRAEAAAEKVEKAAGEGS